MGEVPRTSGASRAPVQARAVATRRRLVEAATEILTERGYDALTTNEVSKRAGVSRGAQLHHFPSRAALVEAAVELLLERRGETVRRRLASVDPAMSIVELLHELWPAFHDETFATWAQLWVAALTDPDLAERLLDVDRRFTETTRAEFRELVARQRSVDPARADLARDFVVAVLVGLGFQRLLQRERRDITDYLSVAAQAAEVVLGPPSGEVDR